MTTYIVLDRQDNVIARNLTARKAMHEILTDSGRSYFVRKAPGSTAPDEFELCITTREADDGSHRWLYSVVSVKAPNVDEATDKIAERVISLNWATHPRAISNEK